MVTVTNYVERQRKDGSSTFISLELTGGVELIQSSTTGKFYATVRKCNIPSTFSEDVAKTILGSQLKGNIVRVPVEPYEFVNKQTGEVMMLQHSYAYQPEGSMELIGATEVKSFAMA